MASWLRVLGLRFALLGALVAAVLATSLLVPRPDLPFALLESFDQAFALVYDRAERQVAELEAAPGAASRRDVFALLAELEDRIAGTCEAAGTALDVELVLASSLAPDRRAAVLDSIDRHLWQAEYALVHARDPGERAEYETTCARLREVRAMV